MVEEAEARVKAQEKSMEISKLSHEFTRVTSPIDGQISRYYLTLGNLVNQDQTLLTTVVSVDPMYVFFDMDEPTLLRTRKAINEGRIKVPAKGTKLPVLMGLQGEEGFPHRGDDQLREQPGQSHHRQHPGSRRLSQPPAARGAPAVIAGHVRQSPAADRPTLSGPAGHRSRHRFGPGAQVRLRARRQQQGRSIAGSRPGRFRTTDCASSSKG